MGYSLELKTSSRQQQTSNIVKEKFLSPRANQNLKFQDKRKVENPFGELRHSAGDGPVVQRKSSGDNQKQLFGSNTSKDDELVKHMSNLPGYLQRLERGVKVQENALNFGVLDWERLEKWKYNEKRIPTRGNMKAPSSSSSSSFTGQSRSFASQRKRPASHGYHRNPSYEERFPQDVQPSQGKTIQIRDSNTAQRSSLAGQRNLCLKDKSAGRNYSETNLDRGKRKESDRMTTSEKETSSSDWRKHGFPGSLLDTMSSQGSETETKADEEFNDGHQKIVLLLPKHSPKKHFSESSELSKSRTSFDGKLMEANRKRFSYCFSPEELHPVELYSDIPHSCPLPIIVATNNESDMKSNIEPSSSSIIETSRRLDQDIAEQLVGKGRHPSPNRRFSFSLSKMTRSFSLKEGSGVTQLSPTHATIKSRPVWSEACVGLDNFNREKANAGNRGRSSPLRRLLDPLLKSKGAHSAETAQPSKGNLNSVSFKPSELVRNKNHEASTVRALLQLIIKNGLPLFKFVVDNSSDILAASVKKLPTSGKDDSSLIYAFYSVHEIKKKSGGWINQGSKGKTCGLGYNIVGQMKVSSSYLPDFTGQKMMDQYVVRESVLYGVDLGQVDKETPEFLPNKELAGIVVKNRIEKTDEGEESDENNHYMRNGFTENEENGNSISTVVILPGGIHGLPNKGVPSSLITRWSSGGSCDCGGWDVGCKLRILTNQDQSRKISRPSMSCSTTDRLDLFVEDGHQENKPIFSLAPFNNGLYSVEYNASISSLQAFSICVAAIGSRKSSDVSEASNLSEAKLFPESMTRSDTMKTSSSVPPPPPSPFGRV